MNRTRIDWAQYSFNPVVGCLGPDAQGPCDYCYAKRIAERFGGPDAFKPTLHEERLNEPSKLRKPSRIFVCSMSDLFGDWVSDDWIDKVFAACDEAPQHQYLFLTKNPKRYDRLIHMKPRPNWWFGATFDTQDHTKIFRNDLWLLREWEYGWHTWASAEPLLEDIADSMDWDTIDWLVMGAMTGPGSTKRQPKREWIDTLILSAAIERIPIFMKSSLSSFFAAPLIQQYPKGLEVENDGL